MKLIDRECVIKDYVYITIMTLKVNEDVGILILYGPSQVILFLKICSMFIDKRTKGSTQIPEAGLSGSLCCRVIPSILMY